MSEELETQRAVLPEMNLVVSFVSADLLTNLANDRRLTRNLLQMRHQIAFLTEFFVAMRALKSFLVAVLHVAQLLVEGVELLFTNRSGWLFFM